MMLKFLQDELAGLKSRWPRVLALLTCLAMALVVAQQERAIEAQGSLIGALSGDSNQLQKMRSGDKSQPRISIYITDSHILEPKQQAKPAPAQEPAEEQPPQPMRVQKLI